MTASRALAAAAALVLAAACDREVAPMRTPAQALRTFTLPPGYRMELVAAEPLVRDPVAIDFDPDGRIYVAEMSGYMPSVTGEGEDLPSGRIVVLEDVDRDGVMDRRTVFLDSLVLPRTVSVLAHGVLVGAPPYLWLARDTTGDLRADVRTIVRDDYGAADANPEHNANGALWGIDNWIHSANHTQELRLRADGTFEVRTTASLGQWGVSSDEYGRLFRNSNEDPLRTDLVPAHAAPHLDARAAMRGVYQSLTPNVAVFPRHKTPAINRGYRERTMRADSSLAHYTSAGSPTAYTGDRFPDSVRSTVFVTEPAGNLVGQFTVTEAGGALLTARRTDDSTDFLTSTDERFRPVNLANAPDGTLYVVDMYRGIIQHRTFITDYLEQKIRERGLEQQVGYGRIYRIAYGERRREAPPSLSRAPAAQLVATLAHPRGWWRMTAQRLLVERRDTTMAAALRAMLGHTDDRARLHALWTLDGMGVADTASVPGALADASPHVRSAAVRIAEPWIGGGDARMRDAVVARTADAAMAVRRHAALALMSFPSAARFAALAAWTDRGEPDAVSAELMARVADARAPDLLRRAQSHPADSGRVLVEAFAAAIGRSAAAPAVHHVLAQAADSARSRTERIALLAGLARGSTEARRQLDVAARPSALLALAESRDTLVRASVRLLEARLNWPGKPRPDPNALRPLSSGEVARIAAGKAEFARICAACHLADGGGAPGVAASLVRSTYVNGSPLRLIRILLQGKEGAMLMPPVGATMTDEQVAAVLSYVRREWGNTADPIAPAQVTEIRGATTGRSLPWTDDELARINR